MVGSTGSGKTTLGRLIARFADPTNGTVAVGGVPLTDVARSDLRSRLVVVSQEPFLFDDTVERNIAFARSGAGRADVEAIVRDLDVGEWVDALSEGLDTRVGERGGQLSAGERQLVALLRAGLADPDVLILDEATSSVDALTEVRIARALDVLASTRTTIAIAHRLSTAARSDRVLVLADGVLVEDGHHDDLVQQGGTYAEPLRRLGVSHQCRRRRVHTVEHMTQPASKSLASVTHCSGSCLSPAVAEKTTDRRNECRNQSANAPRWRYRTDEIPDDAPTLILLLGMSETESFWGLLNDEVIHVTESSVRRAQFAELADEYRDAVDNGLDETVASLTRQDDGGWACRSET